jgi:hypothetical protein
MVLPHIKKELSGGSNFSEGQIQQNENSELEGYTFAFL